MKISQISRKYFVAGLLCVGCGIALGVGIYEYNATQVSTPASYMPQGALLSLEADDFSSLLHAWNTSEEKRAWVRGENYSAFSRSRLFERLAQAQTEFSEIAAINADSSMLEAIAGKQSALALYDIGKLEFVYVTRLDASHVEMLPLWQARDKFEHRSEAGTDFYLRRDSKSGREAAFAQRDGWLILGTRQDLVAGVLDRMAGKSAQSLTTEAWYAESVKHAGHRGEMRMVLDLAHIVPSPYFRSYWVQRNITEMKQYASAVSDLFLDGSVYREEHLLLRRENAGTTSQGDVQSLFSSAPDDASLTIAQVTSDSTQVLQAMREDLLERGPVGSIAGTVKAPSLVVGENAGSSAQLDVDLTSAPHVEAQADVYQSLRGVLKDASPLRYLRCYRSPEQNTTPFVGIHSAIVIDAGNRWNGDSIRNAITSVLAAGATVNSLGTQWQKRTISAGEYDALDGPIALFLKVDANRLYLSTDASLLESILVRAKNIPPTVSDNQTYRAVFRVTPTRPGFSHLMQQLDFVNRQRPGNAGGDADSQSEPSNGAPPDFFSGNIASLGRAFDRLDSEQVSEQDQGDVVRQTVLYRWKP